MAVIYIELSICVDRTHTKINMNEDNKISKKTLSAKTAGNTAVKGQNTSSSTAPKVLAPAKRVNITVKSTQAVKTTVETKSKAISTKTKTSPLKTPVAKKDSSNLLVKKTSTSKAHPKSSGPVDSNVKQNAIAKSTVKVKKNKVIRDSFTIPKDEYQTIHDLKLRSAKLGHGMKKSELIRAGIKVLSILSDSAFTQAIAQIPMIKTGRPKTN